MSLVMPRQSADRCFDIFLQRLPLIQHCSDLCTVLLLQSPASSKPSSSASKNLLLPLTTAATPVLHQACNTPGFSYQEIPTPLSIFSAIYFTFLIFWCLSARFCSTTSAVSVLPDFCSCQYYCLLWPVAPLESSGKSHQAIRIEKTLENPVSPWNITEKVRDCLTANQSTSTSGKRDVLLFGKSITGPKTCQLKGNNCKSC